METVDVLIVGSGPAGMSTALHLVHASPAWAQRIAVVDKAVHPREKLCGGGITRLGVDVLAGLGLALEPAHVPVQEVRIRFGPHAYAAHDDPILWITRRDELDHWLVRVGRARGIPVHEGEAVQAVHSMTDGMAVTTAHRTFRARVLVAADGSKSAVRRLLKWGERARSARLLEVLTPEDPQERFEYRERVAVFDFTPMLDGLQGYSWNFPSYVQGKAMMNRGVFDSRVRPERPRADLKGALREALARSGRSLDDYPLAGHPVFLFDPRSTFSRPHVLLVGDAAGADPLFGEGIAFALAYGEAAAATIQDAFLRNDFGFGEYRYRILAHPVLGQLSMRARVARFLYWLPRLPWLMKLLWGQTPLLFRLFARLRPHYIPMSEPRLARLDTLG